MPGRGWAESRSVGDVTILHFCPRADWAAAGPAGRYAADPHATVGFIHPHLYRPLPAGAERERRG